MIFITLGSQKFQFNRLLKSVDNLIQKEIIVDKVFAQIGYSDYIPQNYTYKKFLDRNEFNKLESECDVLITHGGTGAIISGLKKEKKIIAIPRLAEYGEHVDNHQLQIIEQFKKQNLICGIKSCDELEQALIYIKTHNFNRYISNTEKIINSIERFIQE